MTEQKYSLLILSSELSPFAKTGGLGDMVASLAAALLRRGHEVGVVLPLYREIKTRGIDLSSVLPSMCVRMGAGEIWCAVRYCITGENIPLYLIEHDDFFNRAGLYNDHEYKDYEDNPLRFGFFCLAALQMAIDMNLKPDVIQVNDWQTALASVYLKTWFRNHSLLGRTASVLTIHNASYQGVFPMECHRLLGLQAHSLTSESGEDHGRVNFLKEGIHYADAVNTVSPRHAEEMKASIGGFGLTSLIANKGESFLGILNGVDYDIWSPEKDGLIPKQYSVTDMSGKICCKKNLQRQFNLEENTGIALIGFIGRLAAQKGIRLLKAVVERVIRDMVAQIVFLGSGEPEFEHYFAALPLRYPGKIGAHIGFNDQLAHSIEAGSDFFVMPSLHEPCGLNQMYSLRYGTLPIVRATGGLDDTVENYDEATGNGTGFKFYDPTADALYFTIGWAISTYYDRPHHMRLLMEKAMRQDFSWERSVREYEDLFVMATEAKNI